MAVALGTREGRVLASEAGLSQDGESPEATLAAVAGMIRGMSQRTGLRPVSVGVGMPGLVDVRSGTVQFLPNRPPAWRGVNAGTILEHHLGIPARIMNDARCAALGELLYGYGRDYSTFVLFTLGNGVGGGIVIDGRLRLGPLGAAGEIGHQTVNPDGPVCGCGNRGCVEAVASGPAIARAAGYSDVETAAIAARSGDAAARRAFDAAGASLGIAAANLVTALHPEAVLFTGELSDLVELLLLPVRAAINERVRLFPADGVAVRRAGAGTHAAVLGALAINANPDRLIF